MPRFTIEGDPIRMAYGFDKRSGVFLSVYDKRLKYNSDASREVNKVTEAIGVKDGGGSYFDLHTGRHGFGLKVDDKTMATYLQRFGVPPSNIALLPLKLSGSYWDKIKTHEERDTPYCALCHKVSTAKKCSKCQVVSYCSRECQVQDWPFHKIFCGIQSIPSRQPVADHSVQALLLPKDKNTPLLVCLPLRNKYDDLGGFSWLDVSDFIPGVKGCARSDRTQGCVDDQASCAFHLLFKDDFSVDGTSEENICITHIFGQKELSFGDMPWRNNVLLAKSDKRQDPSYESLQKADIPKAVDFLIKYSIFTL
ncbi:hypothetical protein ACA910_000311 [Epithemia clementina (nom. ined.)]